MKVEALIFNLITVFCIVTAIVYGVWSREPIGTTALLLSGGLTSLIGGFFWFVSRRIDARPEDLKDAEIADGAGELGFFPPYSWWPLWCALCLAMMVLGLAIGWWLFIIGAAIGAVTVCGWIYEYYRGIHAH